MQFGMLMMLNLGTGLCTPPVGTLPVRRLLDRQDQIEETVKTIWPFYLRDVRRADARHLRAGGVAVAAELRLLEG